jgi:hypothetical protein
LTVSRRPSVFVLGLTVGDYLLWNWSLNNGHDVLALISGLTLPPLALVSVWVLAAGAIRLLAALAAISQRPRASAAAERARPGVTAARTQPGQQRRAGTGPEAGQAAAARAGKQSRRIAA